MKMILFTKEEFERWESLLTTERKEFLVSFDLGKSSVTVSKNDLEHLIGSIKASLSNERLKSGWVYAFNGEVYRLAFFTDHLYRLRVLPGIKEPILEVDGVRMHLTKEVSPREYAEEVAEILNLSGNELVLECCMGLGYLTLSLAKRSKKVITVEKSREVLELAKLNPYSQELFELPNVEVINGDIVEVLPSLGKFDRIVHDPPRYSHAPLLYSRSFYSQLLEHVRGKALLWHYTGSLGKMKGKAFYERVWKRLLDSGWKPTKYFRKLQGILAVHSSSL